jgi:hypothetical protein
MVRVSASRLGWASAFQFRPGWESVLASGWEWVY